MRAIEALKKSDLILHAGDVGSREILERLQEIAPVAAVRGDATGTYVVVEIKKAQGTDQVLGQVLRYMGWVKEAKGADKVRGIIIVQSKDRRLSYAVKAATNVEIREYGMVFAKSA